MTEVTHFDSLARAGRFRQKEVTFREGMNESEFFVEDIKYLEEIAAENPLYTVTLVVRRRDKNGAYGVQENLHLTEQGLEGPHAVRLKRG